METTTEEVTIRAWQQTRIDGLRAALDILEANPELANACWISGNITAWTNTKEDFDRLRRQIGPHTKDVNSYSAIATHPINDEVTLRVETSRDQVCTKVKTGEKLVEKEVLPEGVKMLTEVVTEDVYEWVCPDSWGAE